jgi:hypothetical protein
MKLSRFPYCVARANARTYMQSRFGIHIREPSKLIPGKSPIRAVSPSHAMELVEFQNNQQVFIHGVATTPTVLINAFSEHVLAHKLLGLSKF